MVCFFVKVSFVGIVVFGNGVEVFLLVVFYLGRGGLLNSVVNVVCSVFVGKDRV